MKIKSFLKITMMSVLAGGLSFSCSDDDNDNTTQNQRVTLFASNNSNGNITAYDLNTGSAITTSTLITTSTAADGVYFDDDTNTLVQASRSDNGLEGFNVSTEFVNGTLLNIDIDGSNDMTSPRELAVDGDLYVVADNADADGNDTTPDGRLFIYTKSGNAFTLRNIVTTDFKLWGITFNGNDLYAVVDATNELAVFTNFLATNTTNAIVSATKRIAIEGIVRTHGLTYDTATDLMIMTDIGEASNGQDDGGFHVIPNFVSKLNSTPNGGTLAVSQQTRVAGAATLLGNPVDVAYDNVSQTVFIAEAGNGGGRILAFTNIGAGGNLTPAVNNSLASASSVFLSRE